MSIFNSITVGIILFVGMFGVVQYMKAENLKIEVHNKDMAILAYEQVLKNVPFEALNTERKEKANEEINTTISNTAHVDDGNYSL